MLKRKALAKFEYWKAHKNKQALLVDGARQVGKTFLVREFAMQNYTSLAEINFLDDDLAAEAASTATNAGELFTRLTAFFNQPLIPHETLIFLDEIQSCANVTTAIKFLVDRHPEYDYILSGSLLGVELRNIKSIPVGYLDSLTMYPLDFEEYCWAKGLSQHAIDAARASFNEREPIDPYLHQKLLGIFHEYLIIGGMPDPVSRFIQSGNILDARRAQESIIARYREDISKYAPGQERDIKRIYDLIPAELSAQNKRFTISDIAGDAHIERYENDFAWLVDAGVALPTYNVDEPRPPLAIAKNHTLFKLFLSDIGLLACICGMDVTREMLAGRTDILFGAIYENAVAQELIAHGFSLYYFKNKSMGELDFLVETSLMRVLPLEVKSGKTYKRHSALTKALNTENYQFEEAIVLYEGNVLAEDNITYAPIYCAAFLERR